MDGERRRPKANGMEGRGWTSSMMGEEGKVENRTSLEMGGLDM